MARAAAGIVSVRQGAVPRAVRHAVSVHVLLLLDLPEDDGCAHLQRDGEACTLAVVGAKHLRCHHAVIRRPGKRAVRSDGERWFCGACGSHVYVLDDRWPEGVWPNAAALDTPLPSPPSQVHIMLRYKPAWVPAPGRGPRFPEYPELSIADWHAQHGLDGRPRAPRASRRPPPTRRRKPRTRRRTARASG